MEAFENNEFLKYVRYMIVCNHSIDRLCVCVCVCVCVCERGGFSLETGYSCDINRVMGSSDGGGLK